MDRDEYQPRSGAPRKRQRDSFSYPDERKRQRVKREVPVLMTVRKNIVEIGEPVRLSYLFIYSYLTTVKLFNLLHF